MSKGGPKEQIVTNQLDPATERYRNEVFNRARDVSNQSYIPYNKQTVAGPDIASSQALMGMSGMGGVYDSVGRGFNGASGAFGMVPNGINGPNIGPYAGAGANAARALGGDQGAISALMDPYQKNVIDALGGQYDQLRGKAEMATNSDATRAGAFGGDRAALLTGERLGALDRGQASDIANLLSSGYNSTMDRASGTAGLGLNAQNMAGQFGLGLGNLRLGAAQGQLGAAQGQLGVAQGREGALMNQFGMGDYFRGINQQRLDSAHNAFNEQRDWGLRGLNVLQGGLTGMPYGNSQSQPLYNNKFGSVAGGAATGFGIGGPAGAVVGGLGGLLFG